MQTSLDGVPLALLLLLLYGVLASARACWGLFESYKSLHRSVERMSVVPSEFGVGTLERRVSVCLRLLDAARYVRPEMFFVRDM